MAGSGKSLWKTDDEDDIVREYLNENGLFGVQMMDQNQNNSFVLYKVDPEKTQLKDFHRWSDILSADRKDTTEIPEHVWRPFFWVGERLGQVDACGWKEEVSRLKLDQFYTMGQIWEMVTSPSLVPVP